MKYKEERPLANLDAAVSKLLAIANGMEPEPRRKAPGWRDQRAFPSAPAPIAREEESPAAGDAR
jgi:hypothetical protein